MGASDLIEDKIAKYVVMLKCTRATNLPRHLFHE